MEYEFAQLKFRTVAYHCFLNCHNTLQEIENDINIDADNNNNNYTKDFEKIIHYFYNEVEKICSEYNLEFKNELLNVIEIFWRVQGQIYDHIDHFPEFLADHPDIKIDSMQKIQGKLNNRLNKFAISSMNKLKRILITFSNYLKNRNIGDKFLNITSKNELKNTISEIVKETIRDITSNYDQDKILLQQMSKDIPSMLESMQLHDEYTENQVNYFNNTIARSSKYWMKNKNYLI